MADPARPRRSALYVPGANARALEKARTLPADVVILDLEDGVAPDAKQAAREAVAGALAAGGFGPHHERVLRVNGLDTPWGYADLLAAARAMDGAGLDAVLLPKVDGPEIVRQAERVLHGAGGSSALSLWCMIETPRGVLAAEAIAGASPHLGALVLGLEDLAKDLHAAPAKDRAGLVPVLAGVLTAARAHGLAALDGVFTDLDDESGFEAACRQAVALGYDGKTLIHPKTVAAANRLFAPDEAALERARRIIEAHRAALAGGHGVTVVDGKLVERLHVDEARRLVALAEAVAARGGEARDEAGSAS
ncbi:MAG: CoA ester lyase [Azospirillaceae bacterium]